MGRVGWWCGVVLLISGCASFNPFSNPADRVGEALAEHRYRQALSVIDSAGEHHPQRGLLQEQREGVVQASREYREQVLGQARLLAAREEWQSAHRILEQARERVVEPEPVEALRDQLRQREADTLRDRLADWYLAQARALLATPTLDRTLAHHRDQEARRALRERDQQRRSLAVSLRALGDDYASEKRWEQALTTLNAAQRLEPDAAPPAALDQAKSHLDSARHRARDARGQAHHQQARQLLEAYRRSGELDDLLAARTYLAQHQDDRLAPLHDQVEAWSQERFNQGMQRGEALYAQGDYETAYRLWQRVAPLDPDNSELQKKLERSERVLRNLRTLDTP